MPSQKRSKQLLYINQYIQLIVPQVGLREESQRGVAHQDPLGGTDFELDLAVESREAAERED
jgi:hypothetical protein